MRTKTLLTPEYVNAATPPKKGERWISDAAIKGFGLRLWSGAKGGSKAFCIRLRDQNGHIIRETFDPFQNSWNVKLLDNGEQCLGSSLDEARNWARDRINVLKGRQSEAERRRRRYERAAIRIREMTFDEAESRTLRRMERQGRNQNYLDQINGLRGAISVELRSSLLEKVDAEAMAMAVTQTSLPFGQSRTLRSFVGQVYKQAAQWYGPLARKHESINQHILRIQRVQKETENPAILDISDEDMSHFLTCLENAAENWRTALAIRFYFETRAKMRRVLCAKWEQIVENTWCPYNGAERKYWFMFTERLNPKALALLDLIRERQRAEGIESEFLFPAAGSTAKEHITTIHRQWARQAKQMGWDDLMLSHVVRRYRKRNTPAYTHSDYNFFVPIY
jgi:hypothetical protein